MKNFVFIVSLGIFLSVFTPALAASKDTIAIFTDANRTVSYFDETGEKINSTVIKKSVYDDNRTAFYNNFNTRPGDLLTANGLEWIYYGGNSIKLIDQNGMTVTESVKVLPSSKNRNAEIVTADLYDDYYGNEILVCNHYYFSVKVRVYSYNENENSVTLIDSFEPFGKRKQIYRGCADIEVGDVDGDAQQEIVILREKNDTSRIKIFSAAGEQEQKFELDEVTGLNYSDWKVTGVADVDADGISEIIVHPKNYPNLIFILSESGAIKYSWNTDMIEGNTRIPYELKIGDVDGDGSAEIITRDKTRKSMVRVYNQQGDIELEFQAFPNAIYKRARNLFVGQYVAD